METKVLVITGMHRSGTSLITQWLKRCGLFVGDRLLPAGIGNTEGHFEDSDFLELHESFLLSRRCPISGFVDRPIGQLTASEKHSARELINLKSSHHNQWGWKEPRTCLFLDVYRDLIPSAFYIIVLRDFNNAVHSMLERHYKSHLQRFETKKGPSRLKWILFKKKSAKQLFKANAEQFLRVWIYYHEQILKHLSEVNPQAYLIVHYSNLLKNDHSVFNVLKHDWQFSLNYYPFDEVYRKELLSEKKNIECYINDDALISKARTIESTLNHIALEDIRVASLVNLSF